MRIKTTSLIQFSSNNEKYTIVILSPYRGLVGAWGGAVEEWRIVVRNVKSPRVPYRRLQIHSIRTSSSATASGSRRTIRALTLRPGRGDGSREGSGDREEARRQATPKKRRLNAIFCRLP